MIEPPIEQLIDQLDAALRAGAMPNRAERERAYLKSDLRHYGTPVPAVRAVARTFRREHQDLARRDLLEVIRRLWDEPPAAVHERRLLAAVLLQAYLPLLTAGDVRLLERLLRGGRTWALVDPLAVDVAGPLLDRLEPATATAALDRWAGDPDFWLRRSALLAHERAFRAGSGDAERFLGYADGMLGEREFFVRKAIGWALRSLSRHDPDRVAGWLLPRARRASGVTLREALKYLTPEQGSAITAARAGDRTVGTRVAHHPTV